MKKTLAFTIFALAALVAPAQDSMLETLRTIASNNLELKSMEASLKGEILDRRQGNLLNGPEIEGEYLFAPKGETNRWGASVSQSFDWPGVYGARKKAIDSQKDVAKMQLAERLTEITLEARLAMVDGVYNNACTRVLDILMANLDTIAADIETGYKAGQYNLLDLKKIRVEAFSLKARLEECRNTLSEIQATIEGLNGGKPINVDMSAYATDGLDRLEQYLEQANSDYGVLASLAAKEVANREAHVATLERLPGFSLGYKHAYEEGDHFNGITASISIPNWGKNYSRQAAQKRAEAAEFASEEHRRQVRADITALYNSATTQKNLLASYQGVVLDEEYPELLLMAYKGGQMNVITYIQETNYYLETRLEYLSAEHQYRRALATLNAMDVAALIL